MEIEIHAYLSLALDADKWTMSRHSRFNPTEIITATHCTGDCVSLSDAVRSGNRRLGTESLSA